MMKTAFRNYFNNGGWINLTATTAIGVLVSYLLMSTMRAAELRFVNREMFMTHDVEIQRRLTLGELRDDKVSEAISTLTAQLARLNGYLDQKAKGNP